MKNIYQFILLNCIKNGKKKVCIQMFNGVAITLLMLNVFVPSAQAQTTSDLILVNKAYIKTAVGDTLDYVDFETMPVDEARSYFFNPNEVPGGEEPYWAWVKSPMGEKEYLAQLEASKPIAEIPMPMLKSAMALSATPSISGAADREFFEQAAASIIVPNLAVASGTDYRNGYLQFSLASPHAGDRFYFVTSANEDITDGAVSVVPNEEGIQIYLGNGTTADRVGQVSKTEDGEDGSPLTIVFNKMLENGDFSTGSYAPWVYNATDYTELNNLDQQPISTYYNSTYGDGTINIGVKRSISKSCAVESGELRLNFSGNIYQVTGGGGYKQDGNGSYHAPYITSSPFSAFNGSTFSFTWRAMNGSDSYEVFGFLLSTGPDNEFYTADDRRTRLFSERGTTRGSTTQEVTIQNADGDYCFEFVCGSYDQTGGLALGASLYIDNVELTSSDANLVINDDIVQQLARLVTYEHTSDNPPLGQRLLTISAENKDKQTSSTTCNLEIKMGENDAPSISASNKVFVYETLSTSPHSIFSSSTVTLTDPDANGNLLTTLSATNALLTLQTTTGLGSLTGNGTSNISFVSTVAAANTAVNSLTFNNPGSFVDYEDVLTINVNDQGYTGTGGVLSDEKNITILYDVAPVISAGQAFSIAVATVNGTAVGIPEADDASGESGSLSNWQITGGNDGNAFSIDAASGIIRVNDNSNFSSHGIYTLSLTVSDGNNTSSAVNVEVNFVDYFYNLSEDAANNTVLGMVKDFDSDYSGYTNWTIATGNSGGIFSIDNTSSELKVLDNTNLDYEQKTQYILTFAVQNELGESENVTIAVNITDVNESSPVIIASQSFSINEHASNGASIGTVLATDDDGSAILSSWTITNGNADGIFAIDPTTGVLTINNNGALDFESADAYNLELSVSDGDNTVTGDIVINILNVNEAPTVVTNTGITVGNDLKTITSTQLNAEDPDNDDGAVNLTYTITQLPTKGYLRINGFDARLNDIVTQKDIDDGDLAYLRYTNQYNALVDYFEFSLKDDEGLGVTGQHFNISYALNSPPVAINDGPYNVNSGASITGNVLSNDTDADNNDLDVVSTPSLSYGSFTAFNLETGDFTYSAPTDYAGTFTFSYSVTDGILSDNATATISVSDNVPPAVVTQNITVQLDETGNVSISDDAVNNGSSDNLGIASYATDIKSFTCANVATPVEVTLTVTDIYENSNSETAVVTVEDNVVPVVVTKDITVQLDETGNASILDDAVNNGSSDNCEIASYATDIKSFTGANVATPVEVTLTVTDIHGNSNTNTAMVTVEDNIAPTWSGCPTDESMETVVDYCYAQISWPLPISADNAGVDHIDFSTSPTVPVAHLGDFALGNFPVGMTTVSYTAFDAAGNSSTCSFDVTVVDSRIPVLTNCPADIGPIYLAPGESTSRINWQQPTPSDNCSGYIFSSSSQPNDPFPPGVTVVNFLVEDASGNTNSCSMNITVVDTVSPVTVCQDLTIYLDAAGAATLALSSVDNGSSDNIGIESMWLSQTSFSCSNVGENFITLTAMDGSGNVGSCISTVTVKDEVAPEAIAQDVDVQLDVNGNGSTTAVLVDNGSNDACGIKSLVLSKTDFTCADILTNPNQVTLTVTDNNDNVSTATAYVTVKDEVAPEAIAQDVDVQLDVNGNGSTTAVLVDNGSNDACGIKSLVLSKIDFTCADILTNPNQVTLTVTDNNDNVSTATAYVTVKDEVAPEAIAQDVDVQLDVNGNGSTTAVLVDNGSNDACGIKSLVLSKIDFTCADILTNPNQVTLTVTDNNDNVSTATAYVTVKDEVAPEAIAQDVDVQLDVNGNGSTTAALVDNGSNDACGIATMTLDKYDFTCADILTNPNQVTLTVTDNNGNVSTATAYVTVKDEVAPEAIAQDVDVQLDVNGNGSTTAVLVDNGSNDACGIKSLVLSKTDFTCADILTNPNQVTLTVTDNNDNVSTATAYVTVKDEVAPEAIAQDVDVQLDVNGNGSTTAVLVDNGSNDACGIKSLVLSKIDFTCADILTNPNQVTLTVTDNNGNVSTATAYVTVKDEVAPEAIAQDVDVQLDVNGNGSTTAVLVDNGSNDACGIKSLVLSKIDFTCADILTNPNQVTLTVTDNNGNVSTATAYVTVKDEVAPEAIAQDVDVQLDVNGNGSTTAVLVDNGSNDACGIKSLVLSKTDFTCADILTNPNQVTLTVTDNNDNVSTATAYVTVKDEVAPEAIAQDVDVQLDVNGNGSTTAVLVDNGSNDACGIATMTLDKYDFDCDDIATNPNQVTLTVTDNNDNVSTATAYVTVKDEVAPEAIAQDVDVQLDVNGNGSTTAVLVDNGSNDACGIKSLVLSKTDFTCADILTNPNQVTLTVTDNNDNVSTATAYVTVKDEVAPEAIAQDVDVQLDVNGNGSTTAVLVDNGSNDACGIKSLVLSKIDFTCADILTNPNQVTLTVTDNNGNVSTATAYVTVKDEVAPEAIAQDVDVQLDVNGNGSTTAVLVDNGSNDACGIKSLVLSKTDFTCADILTNPNQVTLTVTDNNDNVSTATAYVTVKDEVAPEAIAQDVDVQLDVNGNGSTTAVLVDNGSNDACGIKSLVLSKIDFTCADILTNPNQVTLTVTDNNGNVSTATAYVTVKDEVAPEAIAQDVDVQLDVNGNGSTTAALVDNGSNDACGIATMTLDKYDFDCDDIATNPNQVTLTVTDNNDNVSTATAYVTVKDEVAPEAIAQDVDVQLDVNGNGSTTAVLVDNGSNDACGIATMTLDKYDFTCADILTNPNQVTLTVTDNNGNVSTATANVTVKDEVNPVVVTKDITVQLDANGDASVTTTQVDKGSNDNCGIASLELSQTAFDCSEVGDNTVTLTVTDIHGNVNTETATVTVEDNVAPVALCQAVTIQLDANGDASVTAAQVNFGSNDNCGIASLELSQTAFDCSEVGENTEILTVTDVNGNESTCDAVITVEDNVAPNALCQAVTIQLDANGDASVTTTQVDNGSNDNCGIASLELSQTAFDCSEVGDNTVTLTVTDVNGNESTCEAVITVEDNVAPNALCQAVTIQLDANGDASVTTTQVDNGSNDACGIASLELSQTAFDCSDVGDNTVTFTVTDVNGNESTCDAVITVEDNVDPNALCQAVTIQLDANGDASVTTTQVDNGSNDACGIASLELSQTAFDCSEVGDNTVTLTVTDVNGNESTCDAVITVEDNVAPNALCQAVTIQLDANGDASVTTTQVDNGSNDACGIASLELSQTDFVCSEVGDNTVTLTVTDVNGNESTCDAVITVEDNVAPNALCQAVTIQLDANGDASVTAAQVNFGSNDNCGIASLELSQTAFDCSDVGDNTVTLTVTDVNGNESTCDAVITVEDNVAPNAIGQNVAILLDANGDASVTTTQVDNGSNDACGIASLELSQTAFDCSEVGDNTVTLTVTDVNGNESTCDAVITVEDNVAPNALCQAVTIQLDANGDASVTTTQVDNGSNDACGIASLELSQTDFVCSEVGDNTVTLTVTDVNGNESTCDAVITVEDNVAPNALCQAVTIQLDANGDASVTAAQVNFGSNDNCGIASLELSQTAFDCSDVGDNTVTLTVTDVNGNESTCDAVITVEDNVAPNAIGQNVAILLDANGDASVSAEQVDNGSNDNCGIASLSLSRTAFSYLDIGENTVTLTVIDNNGNVSTTSASVLVEDNDFDGDGIGDIADPDADDDGVLDVDDAFPLDSTESVDSDGDGVGDNADKFPNDPTEDRDIDGDGIGDNADIDDDNDGVLDVDEYADADGNVTNVDTDGDGIPNSLDPDDDGDNLNTMDEDRDGNGDPTNDYILGSDVPAYLTSIAIVTKFNNTMLVCNNIQEIFESYRWYKNGELVSTSQDYREPDGLNGTYYLEVDANTGVTLVSDELVFGSTKSAITVFPNPISAGNVINVKIKGNIDTASRISLYDISGRILSNITNVTPNTTIETNGLIHGIYFVRYSIGNTTIKVEKVRVTK